MMTSNCPFLHLSPVRFPDGYFTMISLTDSLEFFSEDLASIKPLKGRLIHKYKTYFVGCIWTFHTSEGVAEVTDNFDSNWMFDCCGEVTSGKQTAPSSTPLA